MPWYSFTIMFIPLKLVVIFPFLFLILVIWVFFLPWTISRKLCQLTDLSTQWNFHLLSTSVVLLFSISFIMLHYWLFTMAAYLSLVCHIPYLRCNVFLLSLFSKCKSKRVPEKYLLLLYWLCQSLWLCVSQQTGKFWKRWEYQTAWCVSREICMQVRKQPLELDMEQQTGSK